MDMGYFYVKERSIGIRNLVQAMGRDDFIPEHLKKFIGSLDFQLYSHGSVSPKQRAAIQKIFTIAIEKRKRAGEFLTEKDPYVHYDKSMLDLIKKKKKSNERRKV